MGLGDIKVIHIISRIFKGVLNKIRCVHFIGEFNKIYKIKK